MTEQAPWMTMSDEDQPNQNRSPWLPILLALIAAGGAIAAAAIAGTIPLLGKGDPSPRPTPSAPSTSSLTCPGPSGPVEHAQTASFSPPSYPSIRMRSVAFSLKYGKQGNGASFVYMEPTGQITGSIPPDQDLYPFLWADPESRDSTFPPQPGSGRYFWGRTQEIFPNEHGCWRNMHRKLGYSGAQGLTFRLYLGLVPHTQHPCLEKLLATKHGREDGQDQDQLSTCGVTFLGYAIIPTRPL